MNSGRGTGLLLALVFSSSLMASPVDFVLSEGRVSGSGSHSVNGYAANALDTSGRNLWNAMLNAVLASSDSASVVKETLGSAGERASLTGLQEVSGQFTPANFSSDVVPSSIDVLADLQVDETPFLQATAGLLVDMPEPATLSILGLVLMALGSLRRKKS